MSIPRILISEPIYHALEPLVYGNRIKFWRDVFARCEAQAFYDPNSMILGPRRNIRSARDTAIELAREKNASHIMFLDDDILVPDHILELLLKVDQDIVGGLMYKDDGKPIVFRSVLTESINDYWTDHPKDRAFECGGVGAGCMLIKMSVFDKIDETFPDLNWYFNYDESGMSMDLRFCRLAMRSGCQVWCVPDPECVQLSHY